MKRLARLTGMSILFVSSTLIGVAIFYKTAITNMVKTRNHKDMWE